MAEDPEFFTEDVPEPGGGSAASMATPSAGGGSGGGGGGGSSDGGHAYGSAHLFGSAPPAPLPSTTSATLAASGGGGGGGGAGGTAAGGGGGAGSHAPDIVIVGPDRPFNKVTKNFREAVESVFDTTKRNLEDTERVNPNGVLVRQACETIRCKMLKNVVLYTAGGADGTERIFEVKCGWCLWGFSIAFISPKPSSNGTKHNFCYQEQGKDNHPNFFTSRTCTSLLPDNPHPAEVQLAPPAAPAPACLRVGHICAKH